MKRATKVWLITAASLVLAGCILFAGVMSALGWDFIKLSTVRYETNIYEIAELFDDIALTTDTADIVFALSDNGACRVECYEDETAKHSVTVEEGTLVIRAVTSEHDYIGLHFSSPRVTVYLPKGEYNALAIHESTGKVEIPAEFTFASADISVRTGSTDFSASASDLVRIEASTGDIRIEGTSAGSLDLSVTTGTVTVSGAAIRGDIAVGVSTGRTILTNTSCKNVTSTGTTGNISLDHVIAADKLSIERSTGNVTFSGCDAAELFLKTSTGDIAGSLLSDKVFLTDTGTGSVDVPQTMAGGRCEVRTDTGDITIRIG